MKKRILSLILSLSLVLGLFPTTALAAGSATAGAFTLTSAETLTEGEDYSYAENILTIKSGKPITVSGTTTSDKIVIEDGLTANVTLSNVSVDVSNMNTCAFEVAGSAACNLTLEGTNMLKSGTSLAGLKVEKNAALTITENSTGSLTAYGGKFGAGIGGVNSGSCGKIVICGGTVTAVGGQFGAGIGYGVNGSGGTFSTGPNGNAMIFASSISDKSQQNNWSGIIFDGNNGVVYGDQTLTDDFEVAVGRTLSIPEDSSLAINKDVTLTNRGTFDINGTLNNNGEIVNHGTLDINGTLNNNGEIINHDRVNIISTLKNDNGSIVDYGTISVEPVAGYYTVSKALTNLAFTGNYRVKDGESYAARITIYDSVHYSLPKFVIVSAGNAILAEGEDYTYDASTGEITVEAGSVTGDIRITADALLNDVASDFTVTATNSGETLEYGVDYIYPTDTNALTILSDKAITIRNADPDTATTHRIYVEDGVNANVTLAGVNIHTQGNGSPFSIADDSTGDVTVTLAEGTENILISGTLDAAGLEKNGDAGSGTLTINGNGTLTATGNWNGAGIGGKTTANIVIESGTIIANGTAGAGIGSSFNNDAYNITIQGGTVTAAGGVRTGGGKTRYGAGIGAGANGSAFNIVITGGSVYATAQGGAQPIGKGSDGGTAEAPTDGSGNRVYLYAIENPQKSDIVINGKDYPDTHGEEAKIYAYLPAKTAQDPNVITVGDTTTERYYGSGKWIEPVEIPAADSTTFTYTGQEQTYTIAESDYYTVSGNKQTNAGTHTVTVALKDKDNTAWSDGTTEDKTYPFVIEKATPQEGHIPDCELTLTENTDGTFTVTITPVDGAEYSFDGQNWSDDNTKKVNHKEDVTGYIRYAETENYHASDAASKTVNAGHGTLAHYHAVEPTCTEDGNIEYYYCPVCKEYFSDAEAHNKIEYGDTVIAKKGHDFSGGFDAYDENGHWHICNREDCAATDTPVSHSFTSYIYNNDATYFEDGTETAVCDGAGCEQTHTRTKTGTKLIDEVNPTGEIAVKENKWKSFINTVTFHIFCKDKYDVTITADDNETGIASVEYLLSETAISESDIASETGWKAYSAFSITDDGKYIIYAKILDNAGNVTYVSSNGLVLDSTAATAPVVTTNGYTPGAWTNGDVVFTISGSTALSGIAKYQYSIDDGASWTDLTVTDGGATLTVSDDSETETGTTYIFRAVSNSGVEGIKSDAVTVKIDKTEPAITVSDYDTAGYLQSDTVTITPVTGVSGIVSVTVSKDNGEAADITESYRSGYEVTENGAYTFTVTNGAGVAATESITYTNIDRATPVVALTATAGGADYADGAWTNKDITLSVFNSTANLGETKFEYKVDDGQWQNYAAPITVFEDTGGTVYTFRAVSASGVVSGEVSITVRLDKTAPVISGVTNGETYDTAQRVEVTDANLESVTLNGEPVDSPFTLAGTAEAGTVCAIVAADKAGNTVTYTVTMKAAVPTDDGGTTDGDKDPASPQTGDGSHILLWIALMFASGIGVAGITVSNKKPRRGAR